MYDQIVLGWVPAAGMALLACGCVYLSVTLRRFMLWTDARDRKVIAYQERWRRRRRRHDDEGEGWKRGGAAD